MRRAEYVECAREFSLKVTRTFGVAPKPDGVIKSEDGSNVERLPSDILTRTFRIGVWDEINAKCHTNIEAYELSWLEVSNLTKAAFLIRESLLQDRDAPSDYVAHLTRAAQMLEGCAERRVRVMLSF
jgi:hypothetical protein